jgi:hypothetical protein
VSNELETCAACHSRRKVIVNNPVPGAPYLDGYLPALLEPGLYYADGHIDQWRWRDQRRARVRLLGVSLSSLAVEEAERQLEFSPPG